MVLALAGGVVGSLLALFLLNDPASHVDEKRLPHEGYLHWQIRLQRNREDARKHPPLPFTLTAVGLYAFVGVLAALIAVTPLEMRWWFFLGGLFAAFFVLSIASGTFGRGVLGPTRRAEPPPTTPA